MGLFKTMNKGSNTTRELVPDQKNWAIKEEIKIPSKPILYGDRFRIQICTDNHKSSAMANALHNISRFGVCHINASEDIKNFLTYYFTKMSRQFSTETLERLVDDFNCPLSLGHPEYFSLTFELNKQQAIEFMELIERASHGVSI